MDSHQTPDWVGPLLWTCTTSAILLAALLIGYHIIKNKRAQLDRRNAAVTDRAAQPDITAPAGPHPEQAGDLPARHHDAPELTGTPTDPNDLAVLQMLKGAKFGENSQIILPSGQSITGQQARELTQDS